MNPLDSIPTTFVIPFSLYSFVSSSLRACRQSLSLNTVVRSLKMIPFCGKSFTSLIFFFNVFDAHGLFYLIVLLMFVLFI